MIYRLIVQQSGKEGNDGVMNKLILERLFDRESEREREREAFFEDNISFPL